MLEKMFFLLQLEVWTELVNAGYINVVDIENDKSIQNNIEEIESILSSNKILPKSDCFGSGNAAEIIVDTIEKAINL